MEVKKDKFSKDYLNLLEYDKLLDRLSKLTLNEKTKKLIYKTKPSSEPKEVSKKNKEIDQFIQIFSREGYFPLNEYPDITEALNLLSIEESVLSPKDLLNITSVLLISRQIKNFLVESVRDKDLLLPLYKNLFSSRETEKIINDSIDPSGMVKDSASRDLRAIRTGIKEVEHKIIGILENMVNSYKYSDVIQEKLVTVRKGRYVIPVKQNFSSKIKGIIHDRSSSGQTIYLEPVNVVELNNKLSDLKIREHIEVRKILKFLTDILRKKIVQIRKTFDAIVYFDYLYTKAKFAKEFKCSIPEISQEVHLIQAKHPIFLLDKKEFKPLDIKIGDENKGLVITGPNTGGKTVFLKTLGLISLMFQSGIPVPVSEGSKIPVFDGVFVDIGDMQSIEENLSTYSAHIENIKKILSNVSEKSLVLLDELIPGTDPDEGAAIGIGILKKLKEKKAYTVVTTHFRQIKIYALSDSYFEVASVGFDKKKLSPTYTVHYHSVGESMAFYIAEKLGFDSSVLEEAKKYLSETSIELNKAIRTLEEYKTRYEKEHEELIKLKLELSSEKEKYEKLTKELEEYKKEKWKKAVKEADEYISKLREEGYRILKEVKESKSGKELEKFIKEKRNSIGDFILEDEDKKEINIGDIVKLKGKGMKGEVISVRENKANVNFNGIKMWVRISDLEKVEDERKERKEIKFNIKKQTHKIQKPEVNLIGLTKEEAIRKLSDFLDKAILEGFSTIRIIHGYGSGILRKAVRDYLDTVPYKIKYEDAPYHEGGMGVTIAHID
ncbi:MAG: endonuclease MutS2 [Aquificota bacterium]|nr:MAG: endonuclease MutS2 [Aquificota bacterium]